MKGVLRVDVQPVRGDHAGHVGVEGLAVQGAEPGQEGRPLLGVGREGPGPDQLVEERLVVVQDLLVRLRLLQHEELPGQRDAGQVRPVAISQPRLPEPGEPAWRQLQVVLHYDGVLPRYPGLPAVEPGRPQTNVTL